MNEFEGFKAVTTGSPQKELAKGEGMDLIREIKGPLSSLMQKKFKPNEIIKIDIEILNSNGLMTESIGWIEDEEKAKNIFSAMQEYLALDNGNKVQRREISKQIALMINS